MRQGFSFDSEGLYRCDRCGKLFEPGHNLHCTRKVKERKSRKLEIPDKIQTVCDYSELENDANKILGDDVEEKSESNGDENI